MKSVSVRVVSVSLWSVMVTAGPAPITQSSPLRLGLDSIQTRPAALAETANISVNSAARAMTRGARRQPARRAGCLAVMGGISVGERRHSLEQRHGGNTTLGCFQRRPLNGRGARPCGLVAESAALHG